MIRFKSIICMLLCAASARAETNLKFAATIEEESLAEDAILLAHCLAERSNQSWEFTSSATGPLWLSLHEEGHEAVGTYHRDGRDFPVRMKPGQNDDTCDHLQPNANAAHDSVNAGSAPSSLGLGAPKALEESPAASIEPLPEESSSNGHAWLWAAAGGAALIAGILVWRAHQPAYRNVNMN